MGWQWVDNKKKTFPKDLNSKNLVNILKKHTTLFKPILANMFRQTFAYLSVLISVVSYVLPVVSAFYHKLLLKLNLKLKKLFTLI